jgi:hypothetical protein
MNNNILISRNLEGRQEKYKQQQIRLFQQEIIEGDVEINEEFYLDFKNVKCKKIIGDVYITINKIPLWFKSIEITGNLIYNNNLTTLEGLPQIVNGYFDCEVNKLTSLDDFPKYIS